MLQSPQTTGSYVTKIFGTGPRGETQAPLPDPLEFIQRGITESLEQIPQLIQQMDRLTTSGGNFAGQLGGNIRKQAEGVETKFTEHC